ncbi:hypothetical protein P12x_005288 [Tundrisphaera lichenicola]|uniref:hypothetical protein n=1 Tax=Tundrisphaera lichenicola TaxID=2029860 RepID=UPI003EB6D6C2
MKFVFLITLGLFSVLASYSHGKYGPAWDQDGGYSKAQSRSMSDFVALHLPPSPSRMVYIWRDKRAAMLAEGWGLKPGDVDNSEALRVLK